MQQVICLRAELSPWGHAHNLAGFTGRLVARHLNNHRDRESFTFSLAARSHSKLEKLAADLHLSAQVPLLNLDVTRVDDVETVVKSAKVVINTVGPYCLWGTPVVRYVRSERCSGSVVDMVCRACAQNGIHYVDLTGPLFVCFLNISLLTVGTTSSQEKLFG